MAHYMTPENARALINAYRKLTRKSEEQSKLIRRYHVNHNTTLKMSNIAKIGYNERQAYIALAKSLKTKYRNHIVEPLFETFPLFKTAQSLNLFYSGIPKVISFRQKVHRRRLSEAFMKSPSYQKLLFKSGQKQAEKMLENKLAEWKKLRNNISNKIRIYKNTGNTKVRNEALNMINKASGYAIPKNVKNTYFKNLGLK
jgi:hypothetical protein